MRSRRTALVTLAVVAVAALTLSVASLVRTAHLDSSAALRNTAMTQAVESQQVLDQTGAAMAELWSYDYRHLERGTKRASALGTADFVKQYSRIFHDIDTLAPKLKAVVTATVLGSGLVSLEGDHASVVVFLDQHARKEATGQDSTAGARLQVSMVRDSGRWKVAGVKPF